MNIRMTAPLTCAHDEVVDLTFKHGGRWNPGTGKSRRSVGRSCALATRCWVRKSAKIPTGDPGYETDPLDAKASDRHFHYAAEPILRAAGNEVGRTVQFFHVDSYEIGSGRSKACNRHGQSDSAMNSRLDAGYDLLPYLPALAGRIVDSREQTDRFLWDIRLHDRLT